jgi:hypothetical protein
LREEDFCAGSIFKPDWGLDFTYDRAVAVNLGRSNLEPRWSAWKPVLLIGAAAGTFLFLFLSWAILATLYATPAKYIALFADRHLSWPGAWRLSSAALMPGALILTAAIALYGFGVIDLVGLSFFFVLHFLVGWVYLIGASCKATRLFPEDFKRNPFTA